MKPGSKLAFVVADMAGGGAQRVISILANHWAEKGHVVTIYTLDDSATSHFELRSPIELKPLSLMQPSSRITEKVVNNSRRIKRLRNALVASNPDRVISFCDGTNVLVSAALLGTSLRLVVSDRVFPTRAETKLVWLAARKLVYARAERIVLQTEDVKATLPRWLHSRISVIPNPIRANLPTIESYERRRFIGAGRLAPQKGFDLLIDAFAQVADRLPDWELEIFGKGPELSKLQQQSSSLGVHERVHLRGAVSDLPLELRRGGVFVLSSRYEGFPNVLLEAMAVGLPVVATRCRSGPESIVEHGTTGLLADHIDASSLSTAMLELAKNQDRRQSFGQRARAVRETYETTRILQLWENALR